jgi:hypothetical protein
VAGKPEAGRRDEANAAKSSLPLNPAVSILLMSLTALAKAGEIEEACRLAGQAYVALRRIDPAAARHFDVLLHRLTPKLIW